MAKTFARKGNGQRVRNSAYRFAIGETPDYDA